MSTLYLVEKCWHHHLKGVTTRSHLKRSQKTSQGSSTSFHCQISIRCITFNSKGQVASSNEKDLLVTQFFFSSLVDLEKGAVV